jgi:hypothetical protein
MAGMGLRMDYDGIDHLNQGIGTMFKSLAMGPLLQQQAAQKAAALDAQAYAHNMAGNESGAKAEGVQLTTANRRGVMDGTLDTSSMPDYQRAAAYLFGLTGKGDPDNIAKASGEFQKQGSIANIQGGTDPLKTAQAYFAVSGKAPFGNAKADGYSLNELTGDQIEGNPTVAKIYRGLETAKTGAQVANAEQSRASAAKSYSGIRVDNAHIGELNARTEQIKSGANPENIENVAQGIANGTLPPLSSVAMLRPAGVAIMNRVKELNPNYRAQDYGTGAKAEKDFATGKNGNSVRSFNTAIEHLDTLSGLADALNNGNVQLINKYGNLIAEKTGNPAPTNFDAAKKIVADEVVKAIVGSGGGVHDREEAARVIKSASSPAQLKSVISTYQELMNGQLHGLRNQYKATTGREDFDKYLSPAAARELAKREAPAAAKTDTVPNPMASPAGMQRKTINGVTYENDGHGWYKVGG